MEGLESRLWRLAQQIYTGGQHVAGSPGERGEAERIAGILEDHTGLEARLVETPLASWRLRHVEPQGLLVAPYVESGYARGRVTRIRGDPALPGSWRPGRGIAVIVEPEDPDDVKAAALLAHEAGYEALIVESPRPRVIVVNGHWGYSYRAGAPSPIPVAYAPPGLVGDEAEIQVEAETVEARGYTLEAGGGEEPIAVGAHYDRWLTGFQDNIAGVAEAAELARLLHKDGREVLLLVFTAEEHGALGYASWYWAWGSRFYFTQLQEAGLLERVRAYVNFDVAANPGLRVSGSPQLVEGARLPVRRWECPECDSLQAAVRGVPTVSIHSLWSREALGVYHTMWDTPDNASPAAMATAVEEAYRLVTMKPRWRALARVLHETLSQGPLEARRLNSMIQMALRRDPEGTYRVLARLMLKPVHYGSYRYEGSHLEALWIPEVSLLPRLLEDLARGSAPREVVEPGEERLLLVPSSGGRPVGRRALMAQVRAAIAEYSRALEEWLRR